MYSEDRFDDFSATCAGQARNADHFAGARLEADSFEFRRTREIIDPQLYLADPRISAGKNLLQLTPGHVLDYLIGVDFPPRAREYHAPVAQDDQPIGDFAEFL